jgi:hypothetical protein
VANKNILLIEPSYKNKYPPLGLMKLAQYHGPRGKGDRVRFIKGEDRSVVGLPWDRIYITTLFSFEFARISQSIDFALEVAHGISDKIFVGGIAASLMHDRFCREPRWRGIRFIRGLLDKAPAQSLLLDEFSEELYADDITGAAIEDLIPDYSILDQIAYRYPVRDAYFVYASRGCIRKCGFCGVPKLEGAQRDTESLTGLINATAALYGPKKDLILMDNNVVASPRFHQIVAEIRDLGFTPGAKFYAGRVPIQRRVDFNQGVDARILCKDPNFLRELSTICIKPLRIAFDHLGLKGPYERAVRYAHQHGLPEMSNYMLYNFHDTPADLFERMRLNVSLNEELGIRIWSFPMRYQPTDLPDRSHVGEHWTRYELRSLQIILQATHGVVSGAPEFFKRAFGDTVEEFRAILRRPHRYIFNREWYEKGGGMAEFDDFEKERLRVGSTDQEELLALLSSCEPREIGELKGRTSSRPVRRLLEFYNPIAKSEEAQIWEFQNRQSKARQLDGEVPEEELVEDAGLLDEAPVMARSAKRSARLSAVAP